MQEWIRKQKLFSIINTYKEILLTILFVFIVVYVAINQSVWLDEGLSIAFARRSLQEIISLTVKIDLHPPLYYIWLHLIQSIFPTSIFMSRVWSILAYLACGLLISNYIKEKRGANSYDAFLALLFFLISPFAMFYASEARSYEIVILVSFIQFIFFEKFLHSGSRKYLLSYVLVSVASIYLFYLFILNLVAQFIYICVERRDVFKKIFGAWFLIFLSYVPWIYFVLWHRLDTKPSHFLEIPWWQIPAIIFTGFSGGRTAITDLNHTHWYWPTVLISIAYTLQFMGLWYLYKDQKYRMYMKLMVYLAGIPLAVCLLISATRFSIFDPRYYSEIFFIFVIFLVLSSLALRDINRRLWMVITAFFLITNTLFISLYLFNPWFKREPWKLVVSEIEAKAESSDAVIFIGCSSPPAPYMEYRKKSIKLINTNGECESFLNSPDQIFQHLTKETEGVQRVWYSQYLEWQRDPNRTMRQAIEKQFKYIDTIGFFKVKFDVYERK